MCLAIPVKICELRDEETAVASVGGVQRTINIALVEGLSEGDYVILHVGYALAKLDADEAERTLALMTQGEVAEALAGTGEVLGEVSVETDGADS
jgi:hydrogenase expression/formation protein HypC